ncbi:sensor histidine kinase [uncultured Chitinophaga sp.]|uniref:sensor histidine kinase n=1 Tax=uncultured Chitinophaga sp. TaxID=339340 RepID=UPI0025D52DE5|nr:histidine kinase [uncultured Chitinophaga sp.]
MRTILTHPFFRLIQHLIFWACTYFVFVQVFKSSSPATKIDYIYAGLFHLTLLPAVYCNLLWLLPEFGNQRKWWLYILLLVALIAVCSWVNDRFFQDWSASIFPDYFFISYFSLWEIAAFFGVYTGLSSLLKLSKSWFTVNDLERKLLEAEKEKVQVELKALKAQINPHFFFNTLNGIYAMSLEKDDRLPDTVLRLSHLMRYFLYDTREEFVSLVKEWEMVKDYIALQQMRSGNELKVNVTVDGEIGEQQLPPMLLITFLENAFKHGAKGNTGTAGITLNLELFSHRLLFRLSNTAGRVDEVEPENYKGLGLENVRRRLALLYPGRHKLTMEEKHNTFTVILELDL